MTRSHRRKRSPAGVSYLSGAANRLPASFFVSVAYDCWAFRRLGVRLDAVNGAIKSWLYRDPNRPVERMTREEGFPLTGREVALTAPLSEEQVRALRVGDVVLISGEMYTGRDAVHAHLMKNAPPGFSANDLAAPIFGYVVMGVLANVWPPSNVARYGRLRALLAAVALAVNVIAI